MTEPETVTISRAEYERLLAAAEDLEALQTVERARANPEEGMPHALVVRLVAGESPVRLFREQRGLSGAELARRAGVDVVQLHDIETGKRRGSVDTLKKIAAVLEVPLDDIA
jgi:mRNA interferase RelE/StbE